MYCMLPQVIALYFTIVSLLFSLTKLSLVLMYTLVAHNKSLWPLNPLLVCKHAYLVKNDHFVYFKTGFGHHLV